ncbi:MAG: 50S ribosomal protein L29 [Verrucomicrobiia bacterium]
MKLKEIKELTKAELIKRRRDLRQETFNLRLQQRSGQISNTSRFREIRQEIARIETVLALKTAALGQGEQAAVAAKE